MNHRSIGSRIARQPRGLTAAGNSQKKFLPSMSLHGSGDLLDYADDDPSIASRKTDRDAFVRERNYIYT